MGAWGNDPFENDAALDFVNVIKRTKKSARAARLKIIFDDYLRFDQDLKNGRNIQQMSERDIADLIASRTSTLEWYKGTGQPFPFNTLPQYESDESMRAWVAEFSGPEVLDGNDQASAAIAAASILASKRGGVIPKTVPNLLLECTEVELEGLCSAAVTALEAILTNNLLAEAWGNSEWQEISLGVKHTISVLSPNYAIKGTSA